MPAGPGGSDELPPEPLDAALIFAPVGALVPAPLAATGKGSTVVCAGHTYERYSDFSVSDPVGGAGGAIGREPHATGCDEFLAIAKKVPVRTTVVPFSLADANEALTRLRDGRIEGAAVLVSVQN